MDKTLVHFMCVHCKAEFWLPTRPGSVSCPNPECRYLWAPNSSVGLLDRGSLEEFHFPDVGPKIQLRQD